MLHFRMKVPKDLRERIDMKEVTVTLRTNHPREAGRKAQRLAWVVKDAFHDIRRGKRGRMAELSPTQIRQLVIESIKRGLDDDERERALHRKKGADEEDLQMEQDTWSFLQTDAWEQLFLNDHRRMEGAVRGLLDEHSLDVPEDSESFPILCREMLKAHIQCLEVMQKRTFGDYTPVEGRALFFPEAQGVQGTGKVVAVSQPQGEEVDHGPLMSEVLVKFIKDKMELGDWTEHTKMDNVPMVEDLIEMVGDMPIGKLSAAHMRDARDRFRKIPKGRRGKAQYADKTLRELSEMDIPEGDRYSLTTLNNRAIKVGGYLNWAKDRGYPVEDGLATVLRLKKSKRERKRASDDRAVFTPEDLVRMFDPESYSDAVKGRPSRFWVPIISLCTGMRIEEICQLSLDDIRKDRGVWCIDVNGEDDKSFKTLASERLVPIPPALKDLGLLEYVDCLKGQGIVRLFPSLTKAKTTGKYSHALSKWFNRYIHEGLDITEDDRGGKKVFHSFRHTYINRCKQLGLDTLKLKQVVGHEQGKDITLDHYGKDYETNIIYREVTCKATPQVDLSSLKDAARSFIG